MIAFVILNYKSSEDTIACIQSIRKLKTKKDVKIIVVDNHSETPEDWKKLKPLCDDFLALEENIGFAKGNNKGCSYAREKYHPDFLVVLNSDTLVQQEDFIDQIYKSYQTTHFDALGPQIKTDGGESVNPFKAYETLEEVNSQIKKTKQLLTIYKNPFLRTLLRWYIQVKSCFIKPYHQENGSKKEEGVALHGCALIFSKKYYEKFKDVFYPVTFLYHEEEFLAYRRRKENLKFVYEPQLVIFHKEGASLNKSIQNNAQKLIFRQQERLRSLEELKRVMEKDLHI